MNGIKKFISQKTRPRRLSPRDGVPYWQERVLLSILLAAVVMGMIAYIPSVYLAVKEELWLVAGSDTFVLLAAIYIFFKPELPYSAKAWGVSTVAYLLGMILLLTLGPFGAGPVWLFFFPLLTALLLGSRASVAALIINGITLVFVGLLIQWNRTELAAQFGFKPWQIASENPGIKWVVICCNFMLINALATLSVTTILNGLHKILTELSASEKKYRRIFDNILDVYCEVTPDSTLLEISPSVEPTLGYTQEEIKGKSIIGLSPQPEKWENLLTQVFSSGQVNGYELEIIGKSGEPVACSAHARLIRAQDGTPQRIVSILRDITQQHAVAKRQKELEERLDRSRKMEAIGLLAGGVAHDLNNVLSGVVTYPDLLMMDVEEGSRMAKGLEVIQNSGIRAAEIVQDLLTLSRRGVTTLKAVDLNQTLDVFLRTPECENILAFHPGVTLESRIEAVHPTIRGSAIHLQKTIMNLIANAAEAQPSGGKILVSTRNIHLDAPVRGYDRVHPGNYLRLSVEDQGEGIETEDLKRIFEPFFTKKVMGRSGSGLGMAVVWGTMQDHCGYIDVTSQRKMGTRFDLYFPITEELPKAHATPSNPEILAGNGETILIVDDQEDQRDIATAALKRLGYAPIALPSGEAAVAYFESGGTADVLLLDMLMEPGMDGLETFRSILDISPGQRAVIASGFSRTQQVTDAMALGAGRYIKKPYTVEKIGFALKEELGH